MLWERRYNGPGNGHDRASALAVDDLGNVYVTGASVGLGTSYDYATIKYNSDGNELWVAREDGPGNGPDFAYALAVDDFGNLYVTGTSFDSTTDFDYTTIKYDAGGNPLWFARYNGPGMIDEAYVLTIDNLGNVYVTGGSYTSETTNAHYDYATIKYDSNGNELWVARYNSPENGYDRARAIAVDNSGNVYVTGECGGFLPIPPDYFDYATIKYDSSGSELWVARYNGPGDYDDRAYALAVDDSGNVYVTGGSFGFGTSYDYATIKYQGTPGIKEYLISKEDDIRIVPNPSRGLTRVYYNPQKKGLATLRIYNTLGNLLYAIKSANGEFRIGPLPIGIYLLRFESASGSKKEKLIVVK
ncbi:MAG: SBBP repeat-containing protein [candidate division WOR-3 bacterium]